MQNKKLAMNAVMALVYQAVAIICGFIIPHMILNYYGSEVNGVINSISQFLQVISFFELGVGAVVQSSLYKPLAEKNNDKISEVLSSGNKFFSMLSKFLLIYVAGLIFMYPHIANQNFDFIFTATLILTMSINLFAQYYFGLVDILLLSADQKAYIQYSVQIITLILNVIVCVIAILCGASIQIVKLVSALIYLLKPLLIRFYVNSHYKINRKKEYKEEPIKQKWNGVAQHIATIVFNSTDSIVLTVCATLSDVSVYSVYFLVVSGITQLCSLVTNGFTPLIGELWAKQKRDELVHTFGWMEWLFHTLIVFMFSCTAKLLVPFVQVYTLGIHDANYIQPVFAALLSIAYALYCIRRPYNIMILAAGHYKETQHSYIITAFINVIISVLFVIRYGLVGVAIGTLAAMGYQLIWMIHYDLNELIDWPLKNLFKQLSVDGLIVLVGCLLTRNIHMDSITYFSWGIMAIKVACIFGVIMILFNSIFYRKKLKKFFIKMRG